MFSGFHKIPPQNSYFSNKYEFYFTLFFHSVNSKLTFLERNVSQRTHLSFGERCAKELCSKTSLYFGRVFKIPKDFLQKVLWSGFGAEAPTDNEHKKRGNAAFLFCQSMLELRSKPPLFTFLERKVNQRTLHRNTPIYFGESFWDSKGLFPKSFLCQGLGQTPQLTTNKKKHILFIIC